MLMYSSINHKKKMCFQTESWIQGLVPGRQELSHWVTSPVHTGFLLKMNTPSHLKAWNSQPSSSVLFFWDSVKVNFECDTELPHLTTGKPGNAILPRKFSHEFAKPGVFLWIPEQLQLTLILEIVSRRFWEKILGALSSLSGQASSMMSTKPLCVQTS